jgi:hypothetical protein
MAANGAEADVIAARRLKAWEHRVRGKSYAEIGRLLGVSNYTAFHDVKATLEKMREESNDTVEHHRSLQLSRLDKAIAVLMPMVEAPETALQAMDRLDKLERRRAELLGLDAPERHAHEVTAGPTNPAEAASLVRDAFGARATPKANDGEPGA